MRRGRACLGEKGLLCVCCVFFCFLLGESTVRFDARVHALQEGQIDVAASDWWTEWGGPTKSCLWSTRTVLPLLLFSETGNNRSICLQLSESESLK